ncbi:nucleotidyltransferase family protein [Thermostichus vulcanus]|nr:nucleotidyltransferase family protein [Thermostichus vulcanus]
MAIANKKSKRRNQMIDQKMIYERLNLTPEKLTDFCKQHHILELSLFGSILRDDFKPDSDIDMLVVFDRSANPHLSLMDLVGMEYQLEDMIGREVDLIEKRSIVDSDNWIRRKNILNTAQIIYASRPVLSA